MSELTAEERAIVEMLTKFSADLLKLPRRSLERMFAHVEKSGTGHEDGEMIDAAVLTVLNEVLLVRDTWNEG